MRPQDPKDVTRDTARTLESGEEGGEDRLECDPRKLM
jgi:hypothetical protein